MRMMKKFWFVPNSAKEYSTVVRLCSSSGGNWPWLRYWTKPLGSWFLFWQKTQFHSLFLVSRSYWMIWEEGFR
jgi:hypothetical protein